MIHKFELYLIFFGADSDMAFLCCALNNPINDAFISSKLTPEQAYYTLIQNTQTESSKTSTRITMINKTFLLVWLLILQVGVQAQFTSKTALSAPDKTSNAFLGSSVSISGDLAVAGANGDNGWRGAVYVYEKTQGAWVFKQKLLSADIAADDYLGISVVTNGTYIIAGAYGKNGSTGAVYIFGLSGGNWVQIQKLTPSSAGEGFGYSLALSGNRLIVGAIYADSFRGAAYVYNLNGNTWTQQQRIVPTDVAENDTFGSAVATNGTQLVVTSVGKDQRKGSAYVYSLAGSTWVQQQKLVASDGIAEDNFGQSAAMSANTIVIGSYGDDDYRGAAYVFGIAGSSWSQQQKLTAASRTQNEGMGYSMSISGNNLVISGAGGDINGVTSPGAAYIFSTTGTTYTQQQRFPGVAGEWFGSAVALNGGDLLIGASLSSVGGVASSGSIQVYESAQAMPVLWDAINATISNQQLTVSWTTSSETNNDRFEVEAST
ncbi:MAG TPA: FG-GAP repeat protein, partial [Niabella sp.]|nr:FG-GAP repeat protein [Niabella sp.]